MGLNQINLTKEHITILGKMPFIARKEMNLQKKVAFALELLDLLIESLDDESFEQITSLKK